MICLLNTPPGLTTSSVFSIAPRLDDFKELQNSNASTETIKEKRTEIIKLARQFDQQMGYRDGRSSSFVTKYTDYHNMQSALPRTGGSQDIEYSPGFSPGQQFTSPQPTFTEMADSAFMDSVRRSNAANPDTDVTNALDMFGEAFNLPAGQSEYLYEQGQPVETFNPDVMKAVNAEIYRIEQEQNRTLTALERGNIAKVVYGELEAR